MGQAEILLEALTGVRDLGDKIGEFDRSLGENLNEETLHQTFRQWLEELSKVASLLFDMFPKSPFTLQQQIPVRYPDSDCEYREHERYATGHA